MWSPNFVCFALYLTVSEISANSCFFKFYIISIAAILIFIWWHQSKCHQKVSSNVIFEKAENSTPCGWKLTYRKCLKFYLSWPWSDMNSRTRSPEHRDHLHIDIKRPAKFHEILRQISICDIVFTSCLQRTCDGAKTNISPYHIWGYNTQSNKLVTLIYFFLKI